MNHMRNYLLAALCAVLFSSCSVRTYDGDKVPVVIITDLYTPAQDPDDNFDILIPFALENIDVKAVVFDVTEEYRKLGESNGIRREPGYISVTQLNYLFDTDVPCGCAPFTRLESEDDTNAEASAFETKGIELLFDVLEKSDRPVHIVSTGSCRPLAVAYNRNPKLMTSDKVACVHVVAGASSEEFMEWNIDLDRNAAARVLKSGMKMALYPCATDRGPFALGQNNAYWGLRTLDFVFQMEPSLRNYCVYSMLSKTNIDYLSYLESPLSEKDSVEFSLYWRDKHLGCRHHIWTLATWQQVAGLGLVSHPDGTATLMKAEEIGMEDIVFDEGLKYVDLAVKDNGLFTFTYSDTPTNITVYYRNDPQENERLMNMALPEFYKKFQSKQMRQ